MSTGRNKVLPAYAVRMKHELFSLDDKLTEAEEFRETHIFLSLAQEEQDLLNEQIKHMRAYADVLAQRVKIEEDRLIK